MNMYSIIEKKRNGHELTKDEISWFVQGFTKGDIPDYQASALMMAIFFRGMTDNETNTLTLEMMNSGDVLDLSMFGEHTADKHSTGGVGDKTTLIVAPIAASLGCKMAKMSGRGLGFTGGTVDKLESIPGFKTSLSPEDFENQVNDIGIAVIGQSGRLAPADKKLYALRDVTATIESIPLIASSIMSKKLAAGANNIVLDVKVGSGAFMKTADDARELAKAMVGIGKALGRRVSAVLSNMDIPLGCAVGNALEVAEAVQILKGKGDTELRNLCIELSAQIIGLCFGWDRKKCTETVTDAIDSGKALNKFEEWIKAQGGDISFVTSGESILPAAITYEVKAGADGYISHMDAASVGRAAGVLGAGREKVGDNIDHSAGIVLLKKTGDHITAGDTVAVLHTSNSSKLSAAESILINSIEISSDKPVQTPLIIDIIS